MVRDVWAVCSLCISLIKYNLDFNTNWVLLIGEPVSAYLHIYIFIFVYDKYQCCMEVFILRYLDMPSQYHCTDTVSVYRYLVSAWIVWSPYLITNCGHIREVAFGERKKSIY